MKKNYFIINPDGDQPVIPGDLIVIDFEEIHDEVRADITLLSERHDTEKFLQLATRRLTGFFQNYCPPSAGEYILCDCDPEIIAYITSENGIAKVYTKEMYDMQDEAYKLNIMRVLSHLDDAFNFLGGLLAKKVLLVYSQDFFNFSGRDLVVTITQKFDL